MSYYESLNPAKPGGKTHAIVEEALGMGVYGAASYGFGWAQNRYREKAHIGGAPLDLAVGGGLSVLTLLGDFFGSKLPVGKTLRKIGASAAPIVRDVGRAGVGAYLHTLGAALGAEGAGIRRALIKESDVPKIKAVLKDSVTFLGDLGKAPKGDFLSSKELAELAR